MFLNLGVEAVIRKCLGSGNSRGNERIMGNSVYGMNQCCVDEGVVIGNALPDRASNVFGR